MTSDTTEPTTEPTNAPIPESDATPAIEEPAAHVLIAGVSPQMLACLLLGVILFGVVVSGAYIATRRSAGSPVTVAVAPKPVPSPARSTPPPATQPAPVAQQKPAAPPAPVVQSAPRPQTAAITADETRGKTFLQVGAIESSAAPKFIEGLIAKGFAPRIAEGPDPAIVRILIGPLSGDALTDMKAKLTAAGVGSFPKTY